jgi:hypothetical protein
MTDGSNNPYYFKADRRKELQRENPCDLNPDSHSSIAKQFNLIEDRMNKYEYNPLTEVFTKDQINVKDDSLRAEKWVKKLDFKTICPELVIKPIIHPFSIVRPEIGEKQIQLLKQWVSVRVSVRASVWVSVGYSVGDSVGAYISSFFILQEWKYTDAKNEENPFQSCIDLWEQGIVPSFDGTTWRLHTKNGIAFEIKKSEL